MENNALQAGSELQNGKYRIVSMLGQGGFGITYRAEQVLLHREVAVKEFFMKDCCERDLSTSHVSVGTGSQRELVSKFRDKFLREAQMIAGLDSPHIVKIHDVFEENGTAYYVMENLSGGSLADKVKKEGPLSEAQAEKYIRQVADALAYIHERNTVHLDVKPSNILLNAKGEAVLIDFGISKHYDKAGEQTSSTPIGISKGYAPLEQGRDGDVSQFKPSTDIYALGATLYHLVSGLVPPDASIVMEDGLDRPQGVSARLWNVIIKAMQPMRAKRPQSIPDFIALLNRQGGKTQKESAKNKPVSQESDETVVVHKASEPPTANKKKDILIKIRNNLTLTLLALLLWFIWNNFPKWKDKLFGNNTIAAIEESITDTADRLSGFENNHEWVDLGLPSGTKWATCNVGAASPTEYGDYFAWGETEIKTKYNWSNYKFYQSGSNYSNVKFTKYNDSKSRGVVDNKNTLELIDDAAHVNWGGNWRMPTDEQWEELEKECTWSWSTIDSVKGYEVKSKSNGRSLFLPASGWQKTATPETGTDGFYWSSTNYSFPVYGGCLRFTSTDVWDASLDRLFGCSVRPVTSVLSNKE